MTLSWVLDYIERGNEPQRTMLSRRMGAGSSGSSSSFGSSLDGTRYANLSPPLAGAVYASLTPPLLNSGRPAPRSGALRIGEPRATATHRASSPSRRIRLKREPLPEEEEWPGLKEVQEASFNTAQPADPTFTEKWSLGEYTEEELERQRMLLAEVEANRARAATSLPPPLPPPAPIPYVILDADSQGEDEEEEPQRTLQQSRWFRDDTGASPSGWGNDTGAGPSGLRKDDNSSDDDGDDPDYSQAIAASLGLFD